MMMMIIITIITTTVVKHNNKYYTIVRPHYLLVVFWATTTLSAVCQRAPRQSNSKHTAQHPYHSTGLVNRKLPYLKLKTTSTPPEQAIAASAASATSTRRSQGVAAGAPYPPLAARLSRLSHNRRCRDASAQH